MSGFEVVGVVLAVLPLVISAIENYENGRTLLAVYNRWGLHLDVLLNELRTQNVHYKQNLHLLLVSADQELDILESTHQYQQQMWSGDVGESLRNHLGVSYESYRDIVVQYHNILTKIAANLKFLPGVVADQPVDLETVIKANPSQDGKFEFRTRIKFTMKRRHVAELIEELHRSNRSLERFQEKSDRIHQFDDEKELRHVEKQANLLWRVRQHANKLFEVLSPRWPSQCHRSHEAKLHLETRLEQQRLAKRSRQLRKKGSTFRITFTSTSHTQDTASLWQEAIVEVLEEDSICNEAVEHLPRGKVILVPPTQGASKQPRIEVNDLCATIMVDKNQYNCSRFSVDIQRKALYSTPEAVPAADQAVNRGNTPQTKIVTLEKLLELGSGPNGPDHGLKLNQRVDLAVVLASSLLQLHQTPFTVEAISCRQVQFLVKATGDLQSVHPIVDTNHPCLPRTFSRHQIKPQDSRLCMRESLLELSILLLELWHNVTFEQFRLKAGLSPGDDYHDRLSGAQRWLDKSREDVITSYWQVVCKCLGLIFDIALQNVAFEEKTFCHTVYAGVVVPLLKNSRYQDIL